jgi:hypothetical protein
MPEEKAAAAPAPAPAPASGVVAERDGAASPDTPLALAYPESGGDDAPAAEGEEDDAKKPAASHDQVRASRPRDLRPRHPPPPPPPRLLRFASLRGRFAFRFPFFFWFRKKKKKRKERKRKLIHLSPVPFAVGARAAGRGGELVPAERASPQGQQQLSSHLISLIIFLLLLLSREITRFLIFFLFHPVANLSLACVI